MAWTRTWRRTAEDDVKGKDWCGRRGCRTESRGGGGVLDRYLGIVEPLRV